VPDPNKRDITEKKKVEEQLKEALEDIRESRRQVLDVLESISDGFFSLDSIWRFTYINSKAQQLLGFRKEGILFKKIWDNLPSAQVLRLYKELTNAAENKTPATFEEFIPLFDKWFEFHVYPYEHGISVYFTDITERKNAEERLTRYRLFAQSARDILLFIRKSDGQIIEANDAAINAYQYSRDELLSLSVYDLRVDTQQFVTEQMEKAAAEGLLFQTTHRRKDGSTFPVEVSSHQAEIDGEYILVSVIRDISERKQIEIALRESEHRVRLKLDSILSPEGDIGDLELGDIIDAPALQSLVDDLYKIAKLPIGIIDLKGKVLVGTGWQDICTKFHRAHPETCKSCMESDLELTRGIPAGEFKLYKCKNGMWDAATPILVGGQHIGNLFWGQFFFDDEPLDYEFFRAQAQKYGFDEEKYLAALEKVPRISRETLNAGMDFYLKFATMLSKLSYSNIKLARSIGERDVLTASLQESEERYRSLFENMLDGFAYCKMLFDDNNRPVDFIYLDVNSAFERLTGLKNVTGKRVTEVIPGIKEAEPELFDIYGRVALTGRPERFEINFKPLGMWLSISVYSTQKEHFVAVFDDISERKRAEGIAQARLRMSVAAANLSLDEMLRMALDEIEAQTGSEIGFCHFLNDDQETLSLQSWSTNTLRNMCTAEGKGSHYPVSQAGVWVDCVHERRPVIHNDYASLPHRKGLPLGHAPVIREMVIPILRGGRIVAIIGMGNKPTDYNETDIDIASLLGDFSWEIVERKRAEEVLAESKRLSDALNTINTSISSTLELDQIMQKVIIEAADAIGAETGAIIFREGDHWLTKYSYGYKENIIGVVLTDEEAPHAALAANLKKPVAINDAYNDLGVNLEVMKKYSIRSVITIPLIARGTTIGILFLNYHTAPVYFTETQIDFAGKLSTSVSLAIENARLYKSQRQIADTLQEALLTVPKNIPGLAYGTLYRSATDTARVGGDFYDIFEIEHGKVGIIIGDVSGKGIEAAALTSIVKNAIKAHTYENETPAIVMAKTNELAIKTSPANTFVTLFFGILDVATGSLVYCSAGHPPAMIKRGSGSVDLLAEHSPVIGAFKGISYENGETKLKVGDTLMLYTDGVIEARSGGGFFGEARLVDYVQKLEVSLPTQIPQRIFDEVMRYSDGKLSDDVALLVVSLKR